MTAREKTALLAAGRWLAGQGWQRIPMLHGVIRSADRQAELDWAATGWLGVTRYDQRNRIVASAAVQVRSVTEGIDVLVALGVLPVWMSTAYAFGSADIWGKAAGWSSVGYTADGGAVCVKPAEPTRAAA
jgi:hypothetical protein